MTTASVASIQLVALRPPAALDLPAPVYPRSRRRREGAVEAAAQSAARAIGSQIGQEIVRGVLDSPTRRRGR